MLHIVSLGQTCCKIENSSHYECCEISESDRLNKKLVPAIMQSHHVQNNSIYDVCPGRMCSSLICCPYQGVDCCSSNGCCPSNTPTCCGSGYGNEWCCGKNQRCASSFMYCIGGAAAISPAFAALLLIFLGITASKHLF